MDAPLFPNIKVCPAPQGHCNHRGNGKRNQQILCRTYFYLPQLPHELLAVLPGAEKQRPERVGHRRPAYEELKPELKASLNEYYKVNSLENYDEVYRAVAFFTFKYGRIDWLESNNEYWLERDAALRTDFHITSGFQTSDMPRIKYKSKMKEYYQKAGIATARYHMVDDLAGCKAFVAQVGYPVVVKPDNGVGASDTHRLSTDKELEEFLAYKEKEHPDVAYIMEEFVRAEVNSYDAIIDAHGNPIFEAGNVSPVSIMDIVNNDDNSIYYIIKDLPEDTRAAGRAAVKSFGVKSRFVHFEFFRMTENQASMGKKGQIVALEVNMLPAAALPRT